MEYDLIEEIGAADWIMNKLQNKHYAQNLYAALCNMQWQKRDVMPILKEELWSCSWRSAGRLVAELRNVGEDYMDFYCSGIGGGMSLSGDRPEGHVGEGTVTEEIESDLFSIGWQPVPWKD